MADKITTIEHLRRQAARSKSYSEIGLAELAGLMASGLESVTHIGMTVTLPAANWLNGSQVVSHESFLADDNFWYIVCADADSFMEYCDTGVNANNVTVNGQMAFRCEITPETDLAVNILRMEVEP